MKKSIVFTLLALLILSSWGANAISLTTIKESISSQRLTPKVGNSENPVSNIKYTVIKSHEWVLQTEESGENKEISLEDQNLKTIPVEVINIIEAHKVVGGMEVIHFEDHQYLFIGLGQRQTGGYEIELLGVEEVDGEIIVHFTEKTPGSDEMVIMVISYPYILIKIESTLPLNIQGETPLGLKKPYWDRRTQ